MNGMNGRIIRSKSNGNSIFLPAAGLRYGTSLNFAGSRGDYWSCLLGTGGSDYVRDVLFNEAHLYAGTYHIRYGGRSVRPVGTQN